MDPPPDSAVYRFLTATVFHMGLLHLAFNMMAFLPIGGSLERSLGTVQVIAPWPKFCESWCCSWLAGRDPQYHTQCLWSRRTMSINLKALRRQLGGAAAMFASCLSFRIEFSGNMAQMQGNNNL